MADTDTTTKLKCDKATELTLDYLTEKVKNKEATASDCMALIKLLDKIGYDYNLGDSTENGEQLIDQMDDPIPDPMAAYDH